MHHGKGILTNNDGSEYHGEFADDMKHGYGIFKYPNSTKHIGYWEMDKLHGIIYFITAE